MNRHAIIGIETVVLLGVLLLGTPGVVRAGESMWTDWKKDLPFELTGEIEAGGQIVQPRGNSSTFDEYRDLDRTDRGGWGHIPQVPYLRLLGEDKARTRFLEIGGTNLSRMDANYYMNAGIYNYLRFNFEFDRTPHVISHSAQTIYNEPSDGIFRLPADPRTTALATALNGVVTPITAAQRTAVESAVSALLHPTGLGFQTDGARFGLSWLPLPELELSTGYSLTIRDGRVPVGTLIGSPGSNALELAVPRDELFHEVKFGAEYVRDWYQLRLNYNFSAFENDISKAEWDNPCGAGAGGCRNPSGLGRVSTLPDNFAHTISGAAGMSLPWWGARLTGGLSYAMWRQNETFLPWTTVAGFTGNTTDTGASSPDAKINIVNGNLNLTTRPLRDLTTTTRYRYYGLDNDTPEHTFTNVLNAGDTTPSVGTEATENRSFRKQNASQEIAWRIFRPITLKGIYEWEHWNRDNREAASSNEHTFRGVMDIQPWPWLLARLSYGQGVRTVHSGGYEPLGGNADSLPQFRKFDQADRTRRKGDAYLQISPLDTLTLSGSFYAQVDDYFNSDFGLKEAKAFGWSAELSWAPIERLNFFMGYAHDEYQSKEQSCAISITPPLPPVPCDPRNVFFVRPRDQLDSVEAGLNLDIIPKRFDLSLGYRFSFGRTKFAVAGVPGVGPGAIGTGGIDLGQPGAVDDVENLFHVFHVVGRFFLTPNWILKLGYQYERYQETDFTTDGIPPSLANLSQANAAADIRSIILGAQHPPYEAHIVAFSLTYKF